MRGVVSGGMVAALKEIAPGSTFDYVVGTSAGALAGAYYLAGEPVLGTSIYYEDLIGREWIDFLRPLRGKPLIDLNFLFDDVMVRRKPLSIDAIVATKVPLHAVATDAHTFEPRDFSSAEVEPSVFREALRATASIPIAMGGPVSVSGAEYVDGSVSQSIPVETALSLDATHVLALLTRPSGNVPHEPSFIQRSLQLPLMDKSLPGLGRAHSSRPSRYASELASLIDLEVETREGPKAHVIQIGAEEPTVGHLERDPQRLYNAALAGAKAVGQAFSADDLHAEDLLRPVRGSQ